MNTEVGACELHGRPCIPLVQVFVAIMAGKRVAPTDLAIITGSSGALISFTVPAGHCLAEAWRIL